MTTIAFGHYCRVYNDAGAIVYAFQNFFIGTNVQSEGVTYVFVPFGFSGMSTSREGELGASTLVFPNNEISRGYISEALRGKRLNEDGWRLPYVVEVDLNILDPATNSVVRKLLTYVGQSTAGGWDDEQASLQLSSVLDAATSDIPTRTLHQRLVGALPFTSNVRLR